MYKYINRIEHFLLEEYGVEVAYDCRYEDSYYRSLKLIEINSDQSVESKLCGLLHEASHVVLNHGGSHSDRASVFEEEEAAWAYGRILAKTLQIDLPPSYEEESGKSLFKYKTHLEREEN